MRKTTRGTERSILDVYVTCEKMLPYITRMIVDENREHTLTNYSSMKHVGRVIEKDHNPVILEMNQEFIGNYRRTLFETSNRQITLR